MDKIHEMFKKSFFFFATAGNLSDISSGKWVVNTAAQTNNSMHNFENKRFRQL